MEQTDPAILYTIINIDDIKNDFTNDQALIEHVRRVATENNDFITLTTTKDAVNYLESFCPDLRLIVL